jgi:putative endonuclease
MTNKSKSTLYVRVTSNLKRRVYEHKNHLIKGSFSDKYNLEYLVYYEFFDNIEDAIKMEKKLKGGSRLKKEELINKFNSEWRDLYEEILEW